MKRLKSLFVPLSPFEWVLFLVSCAAVTIPFFLFSRAAWYYLAASLLGVLSLTFTSKGHVFGEFLMVAFSILYGVISWSFAYYGEMITYLGMTLPVSVAAIVSWLRHPSEKGHAEVRVARLSARDYLVSFLLGVGVSTVFFFLLRALGNPNLPAATVSVFTSFAAVWLTVKRSPFYALAYAVNDVVLVVLWTLAARSDPSYWAMTACFAAFLLNDLYGLCNWHRMLHRQER